MPFAKTKVQIETEKKYKELRKKWKMERGVQIGMFETVAQKIVLNMKNEELTKLIQKEIGNE